METPPSPPVGRSVEWGHAVSWAWLLRCTALQSGSYWKKKKCELPLDIPASLGVPVALSAKSRAPSSWQGVHLLPLLVNPSAISYRGLCQHQQKVPISDMIASFQVNPVYGTEDLQLGVIPTRTHPVVPSSHKTSAIDAAWNCRSHFKCRMSFIRSQQRLQKVILTLSWGKS